MTSVNTFVATQTKNPDYSNMTYLACCALIIQNNQIFVSQRQPFQSNETTYESLVREIKEEVDLNIHSAYPIMSLSIPNNHWVSVWLVEAFTGEAWGKEKQTAKWVSLDQLNTLRFLPSNQPILDYIHQTKVLT